MHKNYVSYYNAGIAEHYQTLHYHSFFVYHQLSFSDTFSFFVTRHNVMHRICVRSSTSGFECHLFKGPNVYIIKHLSVSIRVPSPGRVTTLFDVITSIVSFLWAYTTAARDVTGERVRTAYDVTAACYHKRRTQRNVFCHIWY